MEKDDKAGREEASSRPSFADNLHAAHAGADGPALTIAGYDVERIVNAAVITTGLMAAAVITAPLLLPEIGVGEGTARELIRDCCGNLGTNTGVAGGLNDLINKIPVVGTSINTSGGHNLLVPAMTVLSGYGAGELVSKIEKDNGGKGTFGAIIRTGSVALGAVLALPAMLPGIAHGTMFIANEIAGVPKPGFNNQTGLNLARFIGNTNVCAVIPEGIDPSTFDTETAKAANATMNGVKGTTSLLAGHAACFLPAAVGVGAAVAGSFSSKLSKERQAGSNGVEARGA